MANREANPPGRKRGHLFGVALLLFMPSCMLIGLWAPAAVTVEAAEESAALVGKRMFGPLVMSKTPLTGPLDFVSKIAPKLVDLDWLFAGRRFVAPSDEEPLVFAASADEELGTIVLAEPVESQLAAALFSGVGEPAITLDTSEIWTADLDVIPGILLRDGQQAYDDLMGATFVASSGVPPAPAVPEPGTGTLLVVGLLLLARRSRASR